MSRFSFFVFVAGFAADIPYKVRLQGPSATFREGCRLCEMGNELSEPQDLRDRLPPLVVQVETLLWPGVERVVLYGIFRRPVMSSIFMYFR